MTTPASVAVVTGASGYLGSRICASLESRGWQVVRFVRTPSGGDGREVAYDLAAPISAEAMGVLHSADVLVHAAYDLALTRPLDIWRVNVEGTHRLLDAAGDARLRRILVLSSMSAFEGTTQLYGRAKQDIEAMTEASGACAVRPGLVFGPRPGGMAGALRKLTKLPIVPVIAGGSGLFTVREDDLMAAILALAEAETLRPGSISVANKTPVMLSDLLKALASQDGRPFRAIRIPWQLVFYLLRTAEVFRVRLPFRADSTLGLVRTAPCPSDDGLLTGLGVTLHAFSLEPSDGG
jgi:nucleoside-diphosphate-sugar epimerase